MRHEVTTKDSVPMKVLIILMYITTSTLSKVECESTF